MATLCGEKLQKAYGNPIQQERQPFRTNNIENCHGSFWANRFGALAWLQNTNCIGHCELNGSRDNEINVVGNLAEQNAFSFPFSPLISLSLLRTTRRNWFQWRFVEKLSRRERETTCVSLCRRLLMACKLLD